jgi:hypothetical protein
MDKNCDAPNANPNGSLHGTGTPCVMALIKASLSDGTNLTAQAHGRPFKVSVSPDTHHPS